MRLNKKAMPLLLLPLLTGGAFAADPLPAALDAPGEKVVLTAHADGQQIYDCKAGADGKLSWTFREPVAALTAEGKVAGKHYAGPSWELADGSAIVGKVAGSAPGKGPMDIAWLKLAVVSRRGSGVLSEVTTVQRINTMGGKLEGPCDKEGEMRAMPYTADYIFLRKP